MITQPKYLSVHYLGKDILQSDSSDSITLKKIDNSIIPFTVNFSFIFPQLF